MRCNATLGKAGPLTDAKKSVKFADHHLLKERKKTPKHPGSILKKTPVGVLKSCNATLSVDQSSIETKTSPKLKADQKFLDFMGIKSRLELADCHSLKEHKIRSGPLSEDAIWLMAELQEMVGRSQKPDNIESNKSLGIGEMKRNLSQSNESERQI